MLLDTAITSCSIFSSDIGEGDENKALGRYSIQITDTDFYAFL